MRLVQALFKHTCPILFLLRGNENEIRDILFQITFKLLKHTCSILFLLLPSREYVNVMVQQFSILIFAGDGTLRPIRFEGGVPRTAHPHQRGLSIGSNLAIGTSI